MKKSGLRRGSLAATAAVALLGLTACQGGGSKDTAASEAKPSAKPTQPATPVDALALAVKKLTAVRSANVTMTMSVPTPKDTPGASAGGTTTVTATGKVGWRPLEVAVTMSSPGSPVAGGIKMLMVGTTEYLNLGAAAAKQAGTKPWMKLDLAALAKDAGDGASASLLTGSLQNSNEDPSAQLKMLLGSPQVKRVGAQTLDGVPTEHYAGDFTPATAANESLSAGSLSAADRAKLVAELKKQGVKSERIDIWVSNDDLPVRTDVSTVLATGTTKASLRYSDYSAQGPDIQLPPADQTEDLQDALSQGAGG